MQKERVEYLDIEKALLIIMMVLGHIYLEGPIRHFVYVFHMPAFLVVSGIQYRYSSALEKDFGRFLKSRIYALLIPFLFFELVGVGYHILCFGMQQNLFGYAYNTLTQNWNNGAVGFLIHLFGAEVIMHLILKRFHDPKAQTAFGVVFLLTAFLLPEQFRSIFRIIFIYSAFGILGYNFYYKATPSPLALLLTLTIVVIVSHFRVYISNCYGHPINALIYLVGSLSGSYFILSLSMLIRKCRLLSFYGKNTITILGTHNAILFPIRRFLFPDTSGLLGVLTFLIIMLLEIPIILFLNRFCPFLIGKKRN